MRSPIAQNDCQSAQVAQHPPPRRTNRGFFALSGIRDRNIFSNKEIRHQRLLLV
jgi:hypothetical protein